MQLFKLAIFIVFSFTFLCCQNQVNQEANFQPNVLLIYADDLNNRLGYYGDTIAITPNIDALASEGTVFLNAYCQQPLCNPSRTSMLTGLRPSTLGINTLNVHFREKYPDIVTLPQAFKESGYFTGRVGKVFHQGVPDAIARQSAGADDPKAWNKVIDVPAYELNNNGHYYNATPWDSHGVGAGGAVAWLRAEKGDDRHHDYNVTTEIIQMMEEVKDQPFFLAAGFVRPHVPLVAPKRFFELYDSIDIPLPPSMPNDRADMPAAAYDSWAANFNLSEEDTREAIRAYYACISLVDEQVGRLVESLKGKGLYNNTIIIFVSDHGYQLGAHELWFKNYLFHESVIAPLIFRVPQVSPKRIGEVVELLDVYPSMLEIAGLESATKLEGKSFVELMKAEDPQWKDFAIVECKRGDLIGKALYLQDWSLIDWGERGIELYDLKNDPYQLSNLAQQHPQKVQELQTQLKKEMK
ncbi:MAG: sulfatase [Bacteroidota bacterium]